MLILIFPRRPSHCIGLNLPEIKSALHLVLCTKLQDKVFPESTIIITKACMPKFNYNDRLSVLGLQTLETRRIMTDLTTCYKILNNNIDIDLNSLFTFSHNTHTRGNSKKLAVCRTVNIRDANLFHHCVVNCWNKLPDSVVLATSTSSFKTHLSKFLNTVGSQFYDSVY